MTRNREDKKRNEDEERKEENKVSRKRKWRRRRRAERENVEKGKCESQEIGDRHHLDSPVMSAILVR